MDCNPYDDPREIVCAWCDKPLHLDDEAFWVTDDDVLPRCYAPPPSHAESDYEHEPLALDVLRLEIARDLALL